MSSLQQEGSGERGEALAELGKFFAAAQKYTARTGKPAFMPVCVVDEAWHDLLNRPDEYLAFCNEVLGEGQAIGHVSIKGSGPVEWVSDYEETFGKLPAIWVLRAGGEQNAQAYERYGETGILHASWDCTPDLASLTSTAPGGRPITTTVH